MSIETSQTTQELTRKRSRGKARNGAGYIFRHGDWWYLRYRDWRVQGDLVSRKQVCKKLAAVAAGYRSHKPPDDVRQQANDILVLVKASEQKPEATRLLTEFVDKIFMPHIKQQVRPSTYHGYESRWRRLKPFCAELRLRDTETVDVQRILDLLAHRTELNRSSIRALRNLLSDAFSYAVRSGVMPKGFANPVREVKLPNARPPEETYAYSLDEIRKMILLVAEPARSVIATAAYTGLRRGEIRGLEWADYGEIEFDDGKRSPALHVVRSVWNGIATEPKTAGSKAWVPVIPSLAQMLDAHRHAQERQQEDGRGTDGENAVAGPIFANEDGNPADLNNLLNRQILPALKRCTQCGKRQDGHQNADHDFELDKTLPTWHGWHAFRRGLATNLHRLGVQDKVIQQILRHANVAITQAAYIKTVSADSAAAMQRLEEQLPATNTTQ